MTNKIKLSILSIILSMSLLSCSPKREIISESLSTSEETSSEIDSDSSEEIEELSNPLNEPYIGRQYYLNHIGDIFNVWKKYRGKGITVAIIDVGFNPYHEDFYYEDGTSKISPLSASFMTSGNNTSTRVGIEEVVNMSESHGTFCAGIVGAATNKKGVIGVAPDSTLMLLKTDAKPKSIAKAFKYAADNGARAITISIGSYYNYDGDLVNDGSDLATVFDESVNYCYEHNVVICSAAGNGGNDKPNEYTFPAAVDKIIGVGGLAANSSGEIWSGSSYNSSKQYQFVDVFAPGERMFGMCHYDDKLYDGGHWEGTSFSSPIVAGMAALYFEKYPNKTANDFTSDLYNSCHQITTSKIANKDQLGYGRVDVSSLLNEKSDGKVIVKALTTYVPTYAYIWNSNNLSEYKSWPGEKMKKDENNIYYLEVDSSKYDSIIFTEEGYGTQSVDLLINSFSYGNIYDIAAKSTINDFGNYLVGRYL